MRVGAALGVVSACMLCACGSSSEASPSSSDRAQGRTANALLDALRDKNSTEVCKLLPPNIVKYTGGTKECIRVQNENFATNYPVEGGHRNVRSQLRPRPGRVDQVIDVRRQPRYRRDPFAYPDGTWVVLVSGGRPVTLHRSDLFDTRPSEFTEAKRLAQRGIQCVTISKTPVGLRGTWDALCEDYVGKGRAD